MLAAAALCAALAGATVPAPGALAAGIGGGSALSELTEGAPESTETTSTATTAASTSAQSGISSSILVAGVGAAAVLLIGIMFVIFRDMRRVAPAGEADLLEGANARHSQAALRKRRAKAKAARRQRKRNR